jgi:hypothetical protein
MERARHENVATVLVDPTLLPTLEVHLMALDLRLWPVATAPICTDGPRRAFQLYGVLDGYAGRVRYHRGLGGVPPLDVPHERTA